MLNGRFQITQCRQTSFLMCCHMVVYFGETMHGVPEDLHQQQVLNKEAEVKEIESLNQAAENREEEEDRHPPVKEQAPPGEPIALFTFQSWKAPWQHKFFTDWCRVKEPQNPWNTKVLARCNTVCYLILSDLQGFVVDHLSVSDLQATKKKDPKH
ncbi:hypothetical protein OUZ56_005413 [Daphnia magna]|uniref:Uncharacterized protein n=1 Tax=Daphnia magna TaxID=35525 RepID=A0ABQ9YSR1_9CRUS|nr:hypothetical protein OUZ56_005413 [Daphnia magna]